jgi:hypothetical protein
VNRFPNVPRWPEQEPRRTIHYDKVACDREAERLRALGYTDDQIELYEINGRMCVRPLVRSAPLRTVQQRWPTF